MSIASIAASLWQSATTALGTPNAQTSSFNPGAAKPHGGHHHQRGSGVGSGTSQANDLQSWMLAQQQSASAKSTPHACAAYAASSALGQAAA